jgi:PST family polysaccharide transporter
MVSSAIAIGGAKAGYGYWSLTVMTVAAPLTATVAFWLTTGWVPGRPRRRSGVRSLLRFGGTLTLNGLVAYVAFNLEKVLLGRWWGVDAIGIYGRAYQLINIPTSGLNGAVGEVAFSALSRVQDDLNRFRTYFMKGYSLVVSFTVPVTITCGVFADDMILVILGPKWKEVVPIFRLLAPTILVFAIIMPLGWLMFSLGQVAKSLKIALVFAPLIIIGYIIGLPYGPKGVALAYSAVMTVWVIPHILLCIHGTVISFRDVLSSVSRPLACGIVAGCLAFGLRLLYGGVLSLLPRLILESSVLLVAFFSLLLFVTGQKSLFLDLLRGLRTASPVEESNLVSA